MVDGQTTPLPWVPDIVGVNWKHPESLIIIGSAYAPFIRGISKRRCTLPLSEYLDSGSAGDFLIRFLGSVVIPDPSYYAKIALLAASQNTQAGVVLFDLCRASYAFRGSRIGLNGLDRAAEFTFRDTIKGQKDAAAAVRSRQLFTAYVESKQQRAWTLARLDESRARRILALGSIAEYGLLKLLWDSGIKTIHRMSTPGETWRPNPDYSDRWVFQYACKGQTLEQWLVREDWWVIKGRVNGEEREWRLLPIMHPAARSAKDKDYGRTRALITRM